MYRDVCKIFQEVDEVFKDNKPDLNKIFEFDKYRRYCPWDITGVNNCQHDVAGIDAVYSYLFKEIHQLPLDQQKYENNDNQYTEYMLIWLGYRLFQTPSYSSSTLVDYYNNYILKSHLPFKNDYLIDKKKHLLHANFELINKLYKLLNYLCNIITEPNIYTESTKIKSNISMFQDEFTSLYDEVKECYPYFKLLKNFKKTYDDYRNSIMYTIGNNSFIGTLTIIMSFLNLPLTELKIPNWSDEYMDESLEIEDFMTSGCAKLHSKYLQLEKKNTSQDTQKEQPPSGSDKSGGKGNQQTSERSNPTTEKQNEQPQSEQLPNPKPNTPKQVQKPASKPQQSPKQEPPPKTALPPAAPQTPSTESSKNLPLTGPGSSTTPSTPKKTQPLTKIEPAQSTSTKLGNAQQTPIKASGSIPIKMPAQQAPTKPESTKPTPAQPVILQKTPEQKRLKPSAPSALPKPQRQLPSQPPQKKDTSLQKPQTGGLSHQNGLGDFKSEQKGSGSEKGNADGGKGTPSVDTGGSRDGSGKSGGKPKDNTPKKTNHVNDSPPGPKASSHEKESGNQRNGTGTAPSVQNIGNDTPSGTKNGIGNTQGNADTVNKKNPSSDITNQPQSQNPKQGNTGGGLGRSGEKLTNSTPKKIENVDNSAPGPKAPIQKKGSGNQRNGLITAPSVKNNGNDTPNNINNGPRDIKDNAGTGKSGEGKLNDVPVNHEADGNKKINQHQGTDNKQGSSRDGSGSSGIGSNSSGSGIDTSPSPQTLQPITSLLPSSITPSLPLSQSLSSQTPPVTSSGTQPASPKPILQPQWQSPITLLFTAPETITTTSATTTVPTGEKVEITMPSIESTLPEKNDASKRISRARRSPDPGISISTPTNESGTTSDTSPITGKGSITGTDVKINEKSS
ncbi:CIR protein, partial [Plasmodium chabaudi chabaudi]